MNRKQTKTPTAKATKLSARDKRFVDEYLIDLSPERAALAAGYSATVARTKAYMWVSNGKVKPLVYQAIMAGMEKRSERTKITQDMVLQRYWMIATANPNELTQLRRTCCRHCYGIDHAFQWKDEAEFENAKAREAMAAKQEERPPRDITDEGGYGFDSSLSPHAKCPECHGDGHLSTYFQDTRNLSPAALALFAGVKQSKEGLEVKMHDQKAALDQIARHLGMFNDKLTLKGDEQNPLQVLLQQLPGALITPVKQDKEDT